VCAQVDYEQTVRVRRDTAAGLTVHFSFQLAAYAPAPVQNTCSQGSARGVDEEGGGRQGQSPTPQMRGEGDAVLGRICVGRGTLGTLTPKSVCPKRTSSLTYTLTPRTYSLTDYE